MIRLKKRWDAVRFIHLGQKYRAFLSEPLTAKNPEPSAWGCIEFKDPKGPFQLEIWNPIETEWEFVENFPTLKEAKAVGRLLAGIALNKNF